MRTVMKTKQRSIAKHWRERAGARRRKRTIQSKKKKPAGKFKTHRQKGGGSHNKTVRRSKRITNDSLSTIQCSPAISLVLGRGKRSASSCLLPPDVHHIKSRWNAWVKTKSKHKSKSDSLRGDQLRTIDDEDVEQIRESLFDRNKDVCSDEQCWLDQPFMQTEGGGADVKLSALESRFAPRAPKSWITKPNEWVTNFDIKKVMDQYENAYECFKFIGPSAINFDERNERADGTCVWDDLCNFQLQNFIERKMHKIGIIFNTDVDSGDGEHWISMFINIAKAEIVFFDSVGDPPPPEVVALVDRIVAQSTAIFDKPFTFVSLDGVKHQKKNTECGVYSLYFITHMLKDMTSAAELRRTMLNDEHMSTYRQIFFNMAK